MIIGVFFSLQQLIPSNRFQPLIRLILQKSPDSDTEAQRVAES